MKSFFAAVRFLTILPVPDGWAGDEKTLARSVPFFPPVGLLVGLMASAFDYAVGLILPPFPTGVLTVFVLICLSGGLHMDGLADTADGFFSARNRDKMMEIMRDSRIGVMGVLAVVFVVLSKVALLASLPAPLRGAVIMLMPLTGRAAIVLLMSSLPYARPGGGLATLFAGATVRWHCLWAWGVIFALAGWLLQAPGILASLAALVFAAMLVLYNRSKLGGYTGDTLGAICELAETALLLAAVIFCGQA